MFTLELLGPTQGSETPKGVTWERWVEPDT